MSQNSLNPVTLQQVAHAAGVSVSTASRVLTGKAAAYRISSATAGLVSENAARLGFRPSQVARSLRNRRTGLIGVVLPDVANPFFAAIAREVTLAAEAAGFSVLLADSREETTVERHLIDQLRARMIEGLVVCPVGKESEHLESAFTAGLPMVLVDRVFPASTIVQVTSEHAPAAAQLMQHLLDQGHQRLGILQGLPDTLPNTERLRGIRETLTAGGIRWNEQLVAGDNFTEQSGHESTRRLLKRSPRITALVAFCNPIALGALQALAERRGATDHDLSLVTFDDHPFLNFLSSPLTSACQDVKQLGTRAAALIVEQIKTRERPSQRLYRVPCTLIARKPAMALPSRVPKTAGIPSLELQEN